MDTELHEAIAKLKLLEDQEGRSTSLLDLWKTAQHVSSELDATERLNENVLCELGKAKARNEILSVEIEREEANLQEFNSAYEHLCRNEEFFSIDISQMALKEQSEKLQQKWKLEKEKTFQFKRQLDDSYNFYLRLYESHHQNEEQNLREAEHEIVTEIDGMDNDQQTLKTSYKANIQKKIQSRVISLAEIYTSYLKSHVAFEVESVEFNEKDATVNGSATPSVFLATQLNNLMFTQSTCAPNLSQNQESPSEPGCTFALNFSNDVNMASQTQFTQPMPSEDRNTRNETEDKFKFPKDLNVAFDPQLTKCTPYQSQQPENEDRFMFDFSNTVNEFEDQRNFAINWQPGMSVESQNSQQPSQLSEFTFNF